MLIFIIFVSVYFKLFIMSYLQSHLRDWLLDHNCINISCLEKQCNIKQRDLSFFINERRKLKDDEFLKISEALLDYGYVPLNAE